MNNGLRPLRRVARSGATRRFWVAVAVIYLTVFFTTIDGILIRLAHVNLFLKLLEMPLYAVAYLLLLPSVKILVSLLCYLPLRWVDARNRNKVEDDDSNVHAQVTAVLLYPTYNDFNPTALGVSMQQTRPFDHVYILDDSTDADYRQRVDSFAAAHAGMVDVIRRTRQGGFKAGNLNAFLSTHDNFDVFAVMDSDQHLASDFLTTTLHHMRTESGVGIVQSRPVAAAPTNTFTRTYAPVFNAYVRMSQFVRTRVGFSMFMGRGALISKAAYDEVGGFPELVMEDVPFSFELAERGYRTVYVEDLVSVEEYPVDYNAFRKQQRKTAEGNTEFLKRYWVRVLVSRLPLSQRLDLLAEHTFLLSGAFFGVLLFLTTLFDRQPIFPGWTLAIFGAAGIASIVPGAVALLRTRAWALTPLLFMRTSFLYGSTLRSSLTGIIGVLHGRQAVFHVTPKTVNMTSAGGQASEHRKDATYVACLSALSLLVTGSLFSAVAFCFPVIVSFLSASLLYCGLEISTVTLLLVTGWRALKHSTLQARAILALFLTTLGSFTLLAVLTLFSPWFAVYANGYPILIIGSAVGALLLTLTIWMRYYRRVTVKILRQVWRSMRYRAIFTLGRRPAANVIALRNEGAAR